MKDLEIKELYKVLEDQWGDSDNYINDLIRYSKGLQAELELYKDNQVHLINQLELKDNIIKEAREYIEEHTENVELNIYGIPPVIRAFRGNTQTLLEILEKVEEKK